MRVMLAVLTTLPAAALAAGALAQEPIPMASEREWRAGPVFAVVGTHLLSGREQRVIDGLTLVDEANPQFTCQVERPALPVRGRAVTRLACSDGSEAEVTVDPYGGCGHSLSGQAASLCYGFDARTAARKLMAPPGQALTVRYGRLVLKPTGG